MYEQSGVLRSRLKESDEVLFRAFEKSGEIALNEWLPAIDSGEGSTNAYPHLRNVEHNVDDIIQKFESTPYSKAISLSPAEIYILLSSVWLHDIGKSQSGSNSENHALFTCAFIKKKFSYLGIPSYELAKSIANICQYHCPPKKKDRSTVGLKLHTTVIDPYGEIRERFLAALLTLADCMDEVYTRALPRYVKADSEVGVKASFRRVVRGVYIDPVAQMVRTVLVDSEERKSNGDQVDRECTFTLTEKEESEWKKLVSKSKIGKLKRYLLYKTGKKHIPSLGFLESILRRYLKNKSDFTDVDRCVLGYKLDAENPYIHRSLARGLLEMEFPAKQEYSKKIFPMPKYALDMIVLKSTLANRVKLLEIREFLASSGILVSNWLVDRSEHLYNSQGTETFEPVFNKTYLHNVVEGMWYLSTRIFGTAKFSYDDLASYLAEPNTDKVKKAVRRITILSANLSAAKRGLIDKLGDKRPIQAGHTNWSWRAPLQGEPCDYYMDKEQVLKHLSEEEKVGEPYE